MMLGKDALCSTLTLTLVANDLLLIGHKIRRRGMTEHSVRSDANDAAERTGLPECLAKWHYVTVKLLARETHSNSPNN